MVAGLVVDDGDTRNTTFAAAAEPSRVPERVLRVTSNHPGILLLDLVHNLLHPLRRIAGPTKDLLSSELSYGYQG